MLARSTSFIALGSFLVSLANATPYTCKNDAQTKPTCPDCESSAAAQPSGGSEECDQAVNAGANFFHFYNGNVSRSVKDLELFGGPGEYKLAFSRLFNSRAATPPYHFGGGTLWRHSFQWDLTDDINGWVKITDPSGDRIYFARTSGDLNTWKPHRTSGTHRIYQTGNYYSLRTVNGWRYEFERITGLNGAFYQLNRMIDPASREYPLTYDAQGRLRRVTDPSGRYLELSWTTAAVTGDVVIGSVISSDGRAASYAYDTMTKANTPNHTILKEAQYGDNTKAAYTYEYNPERTGIQPNLVVCDDPRGLGNASRIRYEFYTQFFGLVVKEFNPDDNSLLAERLEDGDNINVHYADGGIQTWSAPANSGGLSPSFTDRTGRTTTATYASGKATNRTRPSGLVETYTRDSIGRITRTLGSDGNYHDFVYDSFGRVLIEKHLAVGKASRITTFTRDAQGLVTRANYPDTSYETWTYNTFGQPLTHRLKNGSSESWQYDAQGSKTQHTDSTGAVSSWTYYDAEDPTGSPEGLVKTSTDPRNRTTTYQYTERGLLKKTIYPDGSYTGLVHDDYGNKIAQTDDGGSLRQWTYGNFRLLLTEIDPLNRVTSYQYGPNGTPCGCATLAHPTLITRPDGTSIKRSYDAQGRLLTETVGYALPVAQTTTRTYDAAGRVATVTDPNNVVTSYGYDLRGRVTSTTADVGGLNLATAITYDQFGNQLTKTMPSVAGALRTTTMTYDIMERVVTVTDPLGLVTKRVFDLGGRVTSQIRAFGTTSARTTSFGYDNANRLLLTTNPDSTTTSITYHPDGTNATRTDEAGHTWTYDSALVTWTDSATSSYTSFNQTVTDPLTHTSTTYNRPMAWSAGVTRSVTAEGRVTETVTDDAGQVVLTRLAPGTADATSTSHGYDLLGRKTVTTIDPGGLNQSTTVIFDAIGRVVSSKDPLDRVTGSTYAVAVSNDSLDPGTRQKITRTLPDSRQQVTRLDAIGRTIVETDPKSQSVKHGYWYETGSPLSLTDAKNQTTSWTYNRRGQLLTKVYPNGGDHAFTYDVLGRLATHVTPKNETCTYGYDLRDRQTLANWSSTTPDTGRTYWANGLLKSIDNGVSKSGFAYDNRNEMTSETQTLTGRPARVVSYQYDADGLRTDIVYPSDRAVELGWNTRAQLESVSADGPPPIATYGYDKAGRTLAVAHENGITESKTWDAAGQLSSNAHLKNGNPASGHGYTLDATGRRAAETFADGTTAARTYGYDTADQVASADYGGNLDDTYAYDAAGNRSSASVASLGGSTITYNANNANQYTSITGLTPISHDANGNLLLQNGVSYVWDSENRLLSVTPNTPAIGDKALVHTYDGQHRRVTRTVKEWTAGGWDDLETIQFIYEGWNVIEEYRLTASDTTLARNFTWGTDLSGSLQGAGGVGGLLLAEEINGGTTTAYHFHYDGNGNVTEITDLSGNPAASYRYDAFGNTLTSTGAYADQNRYRFSTKPLDSEVTNAPLYYYGYRYYDPMTGRWPSRDPIAEEGGVNLYLFCRNNSVVLNDRHGLIVEHYICGITYFWHIESRVDLKVPKINKGSMGFGEDENLFPAVDKAKSDAFNNSTDAMANAINILMQQGNQKYDLVAFDDESPAICYKLCKEDDGSISTEEVIAIDATKKNIKDWGNDNDTLIELNMLLNENVQD
jgi:RHS repeat-associated protein